VIEIINKVLSYDTHKSSDKPNSISATQLLSPLYKIKQILSGKEQDQNMIDIKFKRSAAIGTAFHSRAEEALKDDPTVITEKYLERKIVVDEVVYTISGSFDGIVKTAGGWCLFDWKTGFGKERKQEQLTKDAMQLSLYRWLSQDIYDIEDTGFILFISQSNNVTESYEVTLKDTDYIQNWLEEIIWSALSQTSCDCHSTTTYNSCTYCSIVDCTDRK
jgi:hypothetical protein